jgi:hypothetical protein
VFSFKHPTLDPVDVTGADGRRYTVGWAGGILPEPIHMEIIA